MFPRLYDTGDIQFTFYFTTESFINATWSVQISNLKYASYKPFLRFFLQNSMIRCESFMKRVHLPLELAILISLH